jgi:hypothetical protein
LELTQSGPLPGGNLVSLRPPDRKAAILPCAAGLRTWRKILKNSVAREVSVQELLNYCCHINTCNDARNDVVVETRAAPRFRVTKAARIEYGNNKVACTVRDLSTTGAAIEVSDLAKLPTEFILVVPEDGLRLLCKIAWRGGFRIGVLFA